MLRRNSTQNRHRRPLSRSKSANSICHNPINDLQLFNPAVAERDALRAARLSYYRAHGCKSEGMDHIPRNPAGFYLDGSDSTTSRHDFARRDGIRSRQEGSETSFGLKRQQSIRFTGPDARPRRMLASRASGNPMQSGAGASNRNDSSFGMRHDRDYLPEDKDSAFNSSIVTAVSPLHALDMHHRDGSIGRHTTEDHGDLTSSTSHKLRRSRSMYASMDGDESYFRNDKSMRLKQPHGVSAFATINKENKPLPPTLAMGLRAPKSMSFLRSNRREQTNSTINSSAENDLATQLARAQFREQAEGESRLRAHPSAFFSSKGRRPGSSARMRKSLRNSSNNTVLSSAFSSDTLQVPKNRSLRKTARKVSRSLKSKIKGLFRKGSGSTSSLAPARDSDEESNGNETMVIAPEEASISRGPSRIAALHSVSPSQQPQSCRGSVESCDGEDGQNLDDRSRVTSWTDSVANTTTNQSAAGEWERQRLSVIKENGLHVSSATLNWPHRADAVRTPGQMVAVDSQRVYSALMKRAHEIQETQQDTGEEGTGTIHSYGRVPPRSSSIDQPRVALEPWSPPTIRCVDSSEDDVFQDEKIQTQSARPASDGSNRRKEDEYIKGEDSPQNPDYSPLSASEVWRMSPPKEHCGTGTRAGTESGTRIVDRSSAFFSSPSNHFFRTQSPFRRALQESMRNGIEKPTTGVPQEPGYLGSLSTISLPRRCPSTLSSHRGGHIPCDESVYSCYAEESRFGSVRDSSFRAGRLTESRSMGGFGEVTLMDPSKLSDSRRRGREISNASSVEWKTMLSADVAKLESPTTAGNSKRRGARATLGHVRENAEIESPGD